jgi:tight adherence protein B
LTGWLRPNRTGTRRRHSLISIVAIAAVPVAGVVAIVAALGWTLWPNGSASADPGTPPAPALIVGAITASNGSLSFTVTPRNITTGVDPGSIVVSTDAGPLKSTATPTTTSAAPRAMMIVVDASASASVATISAETAAAQTLAIELPADVQLGLVVLGPTQTIPVVNPYSNRSAFVTALGSSVPGARAPGGRNRLIDALLAAKGGFDAANVPATAERRILLLGVGSDSGSAVAAAEASTQLTAAGVLVDAVAPTPDIAALVTATGGRQLTAADAAGMAIAAQVEGGVFGPALRVTVTVPAVLAGTSATLTVGVPGLTTEVPVTFGGTPAPGPIDVTGPVRAWPSWLGYAFIGVFAAGLVLAGLAMIWPRSVRQARLEQIAHFGPGRVGTAGAGAAAGKDASVSSVIARTALAATRQVVRSGPMEDAITRRLERAGMKLRAHEWVLLRVCLTIAAGALLFSLASTAGAVIGIAIGWLSTMLYQTVRIDRRANQFAEQLPDALQLVIGSLKSGFSLPQAFESLVRESPDPVATEFGRALSEHQLGADISDALERVAQRAENDDLEWAVMSVRIQREVGGNLAEVLQTTVDTMRERSRLRRHVRSLSAEGRLSAYVLIGLPVILGVFMFGYRGQYMRPLLTDPLGITMLAGGGLLFIAGIFWMTRVVKVEA